MSLALKAHLAEKFGLAKDADDAAMTAMASDKIKSGDLALDKYTELLNAKAGESAKDKAGELADSIATKTATAVATALAPALSGIAEVLKSRGETTPPAGGTPPATTKDAGEDTDFNKLADEMEQRLIKRHGLDRPAGGDGAALMKMAYDEASDDGIRIKSAVEQYDHRPTAIVYRKERSKLLDLYGQPMQYNGQEVNHSTARTKFMSAVWMKFQMFPELLTDREKDTVRYILHKEKFLVPNDREDTSARYLTDQERHEVWDEHMKFYGPGGRKAAVVDETGGSGGAYAVPEFFDMDMIVAPTLANEDIPSYCNIIPVARGSAAQNFILGRPTVGAANEPTTSGSPTSVFTVTSFIQNHDTSFFRAAGFIELGRNYISDAHPRLVSEIQQQYLRSVRLWFNEQICTGDGTTEPQGIMNASNTNNVTPTTPTTGPIVIADIAEMLFAVNKEYREDGGRQNAIFIGTDLTYGRIRQIATGVTGDTRFVLGNDLESYQLFGHPYLVEEGGMQNDYLIFAQMRGYRLYLRQGPRFIREDGGDTLTRRNTFLVGVDVRAGGQLDLGGYAAVATGFMT